MQRYLDYAPTQFDRAGAFLPDRADWYVCPCSQTRDSDSLDQSNFAAALDLLGGESATVEVHRFGHWGPGWFELILIDPSDATAVAALTSIVDKLESYPVLDEDDWSQREHEEICEAWDSMPLSDRIEALRNARASIFAARRDSPWDIDTSAGDWPYQLIRC